MSPTTSEDSYKERNLNLYKRVQQCLINIRSLLCLPFKFKGGKKATLLASNVNKYLLHATEKKASQKKDEIALKIIIIIIMYY